MAKQSGVTYEQVMADLKKRNFKPVYLLMGDEDYYIDSITEWMENNILSEDEKTFNLTILYGKDTDCNKIIMSAKRYPMMSEYQVIIVKEAQNIKDISNLSIYLNQPLKSSIIVLCHKHGSMDRRKKAVADIAKYGVLFESKRKYDNEIPGWITNYCHDKGIDIEPKAANLMAEFLGTELGRIVNEIDKLQILLNGQDVKKIDSKLVEKNIGISKDYNNFELVNAIVDRNTLKANRIIDYFAKDPKNNPLIVTTTVLFNFFSNLMLYHWLKDKSDMNIAAELKINPYFVKDYRKAALTYNSGRTLYAIEMLRNMDVKSKGFGNSNTSDRDLLRETVFKIMH